MPEQAKRVNLPLTLRAGNTFDARNHAPGRTAPATGRPVRPACFD